MLLFSSFMIFFIYLYPLYFTYRFFYFLPLCLYCTFFFLLLYLNFAYLLDACVLLSALALIAVLLFSVRYRV